MKIHCFKIIIWLEILLNLNKETLADFTAQEAKLKNILHIR